MKKTSYFLDNDRQERLNLNPFNYHTPIIKTSGNEVWLSVRKKADFKMLYKVLYLWLTENGFFDIDGDKDRMESFYYERVAEGGSKPEMWMWWRTRKIKPLGNPLFSFRLEIDFQILGMTNDTVVIDGQKFKTTNSEINIFMRPYLEMEHKKKSWQSNSFLKSITHWWEFKAYREQIDYHEDELYDQFCKFHAVIKDFLGLNTFYVYRAPYFHPAKGLPQYKL